MESQEVLSQDAEDQRSSANPDQDNDQSHTTTRLVGKSVDWSVAVDNQQADEDIMQISGAGHWFLEGWIGDHVVDFLVDSGSAVTAVSRSIYKMTHRLTFRGACLAWFHSWDSGPSFLLLYVT